MTEPNYTLHLIFSLDALAKAQPLIEKEDRVLLLQDGVYLAQSDLARGKNIYARLIDVKARNINVCPQIEVIDDENWLCLTEHAQNVISW